MKGEEGFATLETITQENNYNILIMNLLGPNLEKLYQFCNSNNSKYDHFYKTIYKDILNHPTFNDDENTSRISDI